MSEKAHGTKSNISANDNPINLNDETILEDLDNILNTNEPSEMKHTPNAESGGSIKKGGE